MYRVSNWHPLLRHTEEVININVWAGSSCLIHHFFDLLKSNHFRSERSSIFVVVVIVFLFLICLCRSGNCTKPDDIDSMCIGYMICFFFFICVQFIVDQSHLAAFLFCYFCSWYLISTSDVSIGISETQAIIWNRNVNDFPAIFK